MGQTWQVLMPDFSVNVITTQGVKVLDLSEDER